MVEEINISKTPFERVEQMSPIIRRMWKNAPPDSIEFNTGVIPPKNSSSFG